MIKEPIRCVHTNDKKYTIEFQDGTPVDNLLPQDEWPYSLAEPDKTIYWKMEMNTPDIEGDYLERRVFNNAIMAWEWKNQINIREALRGETPTIRNRWSDKEHDDLFGSRGGVLYYAWMPKPNLSVNGIMVGNDSYLWGGQPGQKDLASGGAEKIYDLQHTMTHELGHLLGLTHEANYKDHIMWPSYNGQRIPQRNDNYRMSLKYKTRVRNPLADLIIQQRLKRGIK